jgi:hypothetical protein
MRRVTTHLVGPELLDHLGVLAGTARHDVTPHLLGELHGHVPRPTAPAEDEDAEPRPPAIEEGQAAPLDERVIHCAVDEGDGGRVGPRQPLGLDDERRARLDLDVLGQEAVPVRAEALAVHLVADLVRCALGGVHDAGKVRGRDEGGGWGGDRAAQEGEERGRGLRAGVSSDGGGRTAARRRG